MAFGLLNDTIKDHQSLNQRILRSRKIKSAFHTDHFLSFPIYYSKYQISLLPQFGSCSNLIQTGMCGLKRDLNFATIYCNIGQKTSLVKKLDPLYCSFIE
jgi:hypothetical protein